MKRSSSKTRFGSAARQVLRGLDALFFRGRRRAGVVRRRRPAHAARRRLDACGSRARRRGARALRTPAPRRRACRPRAATPARAARPRLRLRGWPWPRLVLAFGDGFAARRAPPALRAGCHPVEYIRALSGASDARTSARRAAAAPPRAAARLGRAAALPGMPRHHAARACVCSTSVSSTRNLRLLHRRQGASMASRSRRRRLGLLRLRRLHLLQQLRSPAPRSRSRRRAPPHLAAARAPPLRAAVAAVALQLLARAGSTLRELLVGQPQALLQVARRCRRRSSGRPLPRRARPGPVRRRRGLLRRAAAAQPGRPRRPAARHHSVLAPARAAARSASASVRGSPRPIRPATHSATSRHVASRLAAAPSAPTAFEDAAAPGPRPRRQRRPRGERRGAAPARTGLGRPTAGRRSTATRGRGGDERQPSRASAGAPAGVGHRAGATVRGSAPSRAATARARRRAAARPSAVARLVRRAPRTPRTRPTCRAAVAGRVPSTTSISASSSDRCVRIVISRFTLGRSRRAASIFRRLPSAWNRFAFTVPTLEPRIARHLLVREVVVDLQDQRRALLLGQPGHRLAHLRRALSSSHPVVDAPAPAIGQRRPTAPRCGRWREARKFRHVFTAIR